MSKKNHKPFGIPSEQSDEGKEKRETRRGITLFGCSAMFLTGVALLIIGLLVYAYTDDPANNPVLILQAIGSILIGLGAILAAAGGMATIAYFFAIWGSKRTENVITNRKTK